MTQILFQAALLLCAALVAPTWAQQYAGDVILNNLPKVPGAEIAYFRITEPTGRNTRLTLMNYYSLQDLDVRVEPTDVRRAIIIIHGLDRDPGTYMIYIQNALRELTSDPNINRSSVAIMAPFFANRRDRLPAASSALVWRGSKWSAGANNHRPNQARTVSSFEVLDQLVRFFDDRTMFPKLRQIVLAGHSLGAQTVARYAQIGNTFPTMSPVLYVIANPNNWAWMDTTRPLAIGDCREYDNWRNGFHNFTEYPMHYGLGLVARGRPAVLSRWQSRSKAFLAGLWDFGDARPGDCAPHTLGRHHFERFLNLIKRFPPRCPEPHRGQCDTVDYVESNHDGQTMLRSEAGQARLFLDNFYGDGSKSHDSGPRQIPGDDPYPVGTP